MTPIKLIYICGYGRSGTTLLDICLGQNPEIFGAGEISTLARHVWVNDEYCACGSPVQACAVWQKVVGEWTAGEGSDFVDEYRRAEEKIEPLFSLARLSGGTLGFYRRATARLLALISAATGRPVLVDSSKMPGRGFAMTGMPEIDLHVVHVVRDGRGVAWSLMKAYKRDVESGLQKDIKPKSWLYTAIRWSVVNLATELLCWKLGRAKSLRVRYEDFVSDPDAVLSRIVGLVSSSSVAVSAHGEMEPGHQVAGNRLRMQRRIRFQKDEAWRNDMPRAKQIAFTLFCAPLLARYGYPLSLEPEAEPNPALTSS